MAIERALDILACPRCRGDLVRSATDSLKCTRPSCGQKFPVKDGIPILLDELSEDLELTRQKWDDEYREKVRDTVVDPDSDQYLASSYAHVRKYLDYCDKGWFLELGCGTARHACLLAKEGYKVAGVDISFTGLQGAKRLFEREGVDGVLVCGDILSLPFRDNVFALVYGGGVIEHFVDTARAVKELARSLVPGGLMTNTVPVVNVASLTYRQLSGNIIDVPLLRQITEFIHLRLLKGRFMIYGYEKSLTMRALRRMHKDAGLTIIDEGLFDSYQEFRLIRGKPLKALARRLARLKPFWPMVYVSATKP